MRSKPFGLDWSSGLLKASILPTRKVSFVTYESKSYETNSLLKKTNTGEIDSRDQFLSD